MKNNYNIAIPDVSNSSGNIQPYKGATNVNGCKIKYNAVQSGRVVKISDYMFEQ